MKKVFIIIGSFIWSLIVFRIALAIHFPLETVKQRIQIQLEKMSGNSMQLEMNNFSLSGIAGISFSDSTLYNKTPEGDASPFILLESMSLELDPFNLLLANIATDLDAKLLNGSISAQVTSNDFTFSSVDVDVLMEKLSLELLPIVTKLISVNVGGQLQSEINLNLDKEKPYKGSSGTIQMEVDGLTLNDLTYQGIGAPNLSFSEAKLKLKIKNGKASVEEGSFISDDLGIDISGDIILRKNLSRSNLKLTLDITLGDNLKLLSNLIPELKKNKIGDNQYRVQVVGTVNSPYIKKQRTRPTRSSATKNVDSRTETKTATPPTKPKLSPEEQRKARRERMKRRKENKRKGNISKDFERPDISSTRINRGQIQVNDEEMEEFEEEIENGEEEEEEGEQEEEEGGDLEENEEE